jgi:predicted nucleic acid-binding protein
VIVVDGSRCSNSCCRPLDLHRHAHLDLLTRAWRLREHVTAYDAMYLALAEALDASIVTCDAPLARAPGHRARIEAIA